MGAETVGFFGVVFDEARVDDDLAPVRRVGWGVGALLAGASVLVAIPLSLWITGPIRRLDAAAAQVAAGDVSVRADDRAWGEAGSLARQFNHMMGRIGELMGEVREAEARARQAQQLASLAELGGGLAHELKNPLTTVKLLVESVRAEAAGAGGVEIAAADLDLLVEQVAKIDGTLEQFVEFARPSQPRLAPVALADAVDSVVRGLAVQAQRRGQGIEVNRPGERVTVQADRLRLEQTIGNLVRNALDHGPAGVPVRVGWRLDGRAVTWWVEDDGPGVPEALKGRVFDPFFTTRDQGLGLGLAIARSAADQHGWDLAVAQVPRGARFELRIPVE